MRQPAILRAILFCIWPLESQANVGLPLFLNYIFYSWLLVIPIIGIEAYVLRKRLAVSIGRASGVASLANIASTIIGTGVVLAASLLLALGFAMTELRGAMADITVLIALIPCFFLSVWIEALVGSPLLKQVSRKNVRAVFFLANQFSYAMLAIVPVVRFIKNAIIHGQIIW